MTIREFLTSLSIFRNNISSWLKSPDTRFNSIFRSQIKEKVLDAKNPFAKNQNSLDELQQTNSNQTQQHRELVSNYSFAKNGTNGHVTDRVYKENLSVENRLITDSQSRLPPLTAKKDRYLQSYRGRYRITELIKDDIRLREYEGFTYPQNKAVRIEEYFLSNIDETKHRELKNRANIKLKTSSGQDFRLITPLDTFTDEQRCYVITQSNFNYITIRKSLSLPDYSRITEHVAIIIKQVLQSLYFLHTQHIAFGNNKNISGLAHGNISIDSLLIDTKQKEIFVYLSNFAVWKDINNNEFKAINHYSLDSFKQNDLRDLGYVALYILFGNNVVENQINWNDSLDIQNWFSRITDIRLRDFIQKLIGIKEPFSNAKEAHDKISELFSKKIEYQPEEVNQKIQPASDIKQNKNSKIFLIILVLLFSSLGFGISWWWEPRSDNKDEPNNQNQANENCCIKVDFANVTDNKKEIKYYIQDSGVWNHLLSKPSLVAYNQTLIQEIGNRLSDERGKKIIAKYQPVKVKSEDIKPKIIQQKINEGEIDFALLTEEIREDNLKELNLEQKVIAYDALVAIVAYSDAHNELSFPKKLNYQITIEKLRELYTQDNDKFANNQLLSEINEKRNIKLYFPDIKKVESDEYSKSEIVHLFEEKILTQNAEDSNNFKELKQNILEREIKIQPDESYLLQSKYIFQNIRNDFERDKTLGIGISLLSRIYGQCSVYPLTLKGEDFTFQPLIQNDGKPIYDNDNNKNIDLCNDKGSYKPNYKALNDKNNPFRFPLVIVYKKDSEYAQKFVEIMQTQKGQELLKEAGFIPAESSSENQSSTE